MKPIFTLLLESYRGLKSQAIYRITLGLSILVAILFLSIGFDEKGVTFLFGLTGFEQEFLSKGSPASTILYMMVFSKLVAGIWLTWVAIILALISCAPIFPNTMTEGGAAMVMTKGVSRLQVFATKFVGSLFFVTVQVGLFVAVVFVAFKWRLGIWNFNLFWYIPAVLLVFISLYSFLVLVAVKTRSVLTALLLTMLLWAVSAILSISANGLYQQIQMQNSVEEAFSAEEGDELEEQDREYDSSLKEWYDKVIWIHTPFPKNGPIMAEAENRLILSETKQMSFGGDEMSEEEQEEVDNQLKELSPQYSSFYSIWSSVLFAFVMLCLAARSFCKRDY